MTPQDKKGADTGFNGFLILPPAIITALGCPRIGLGRAILANGLSELFDLYEVTLLWDGRPHATDGGVTIEAFFLRIHHRFPFSTPLRILLTNCKRETTSLCAQCP